MSFDLHPQLANDTVAVGRLPLCEVLLMNDSQYPWLILVPRVEGAEEAFQLTEAEQVMLQKESSAVGREIMELFAGDKLNIAALGNMVPQLHIHHIVRFRNDPVWPRPVWGEKPRVAYAPAVLAAMLEQLRAKLSSTSGFIAA
ncbi:MAG: diadenosine tetraphosphate (Ap4A) HIT family hydrolase [Pseudoalteromonas tetraodonis]|jgi:diadenosine tetraphosphate (Ap4A) HIT family hydrolase